MSTLYIEDDILIDDIEYVKGKIEFLSGKKIHDMEVINEFICKEKYTKFYIDKKLNTKVLRGKGDEFLWVDTGYKDKNKSTIFISLANKNNRYEGHYVGTVKMLSKMIREIYPKNRKDIEINYLRFQDKYNKKCLKRENQCIEDEYGYILSKLNNKEKHKSIMEEKICQLNKSWESDIEEKIEIIDKTRENKCLVEIDLREQEITIGLLFDILQERERYIQELLEEIENSCEKSEKEIKNLAEIVRKQSIIIKDRTEALTNIRLYGENEIQIKSDFEIQKNHKEKQGHNLLNMHKKIIVLGTANISTQVMKNIITKEYGFEEEDFIYETDYEKIVHASGRILNSNKYQAIIFGCCPHSAKGKGKWSSLIEKCKNDMETVCIVDARNISGNLKVTKGSFRNALNVVCQEIAKVA